MLHKSALVAVLAALQAHAQNLGRWGDRIEFSVVPVAAAVNPKNNKLLVWSAYAADRFKMEADATTLTNVYDPVTGEVSAPEPYHGHDMFCPGISMDVYG